MSETSSKFTYDCLVCGSTLRTNEIAEVIAFGERHEHKDPEAPR